MDEKEFAELAAGAALDALSPAERDAFDAARRAHPEWEALVQADVDTVAALADSVPEALPPLTLRSTLLARIAATPQLPAIDAAVAAVAEPGEPWHARTDGGPVSGPDVPVAEPDATEPAPDDVPGTDAAPPTAVIQAVSRRNWTRGILALAASMLLLVTLGMGAALVNEYVNRPPAVVALQQIEDAPDAQSATVEVTDGGTATAHWSESVGKAVLVSDGLPQISDDQDFELWFVRDGVPISAGTFQTASDAATTALLDGAMQPGDVIAVTIEPQGGSPNGEPSSDPIVAIPTA